MPPQPRQGMDHGHYRYSPIPTRPRLEWPGGAGLALWVVLYLEYWEINPPEDAYRDPRYAAPFGSFFPDYRTHSIREYGNRVGIFRVLEVLDRYRVPVTVAANAEACARSPYLMEAVARRGWEVMAHGTPATRMLTRPMRDEDERAHRDDRYAAVGRVALPLRSTLRAHAIETDALRYHSEGTAGYDLVAKLVHDAFIVARVDHRVPPRASVLRCVSPLPAPCISVAPRATPRYLEAVVTIVSAPTVSTPYRSSGIGGVRAAAPGCSPSKTQSVDTRIILAPTSLAASKSVCVEST